MKKMIHDFQLPFGYSLNLLINNTHYMKMHKLPLSATPMGDLSELKKVNNASNGFKKLMFLTLLSLFLFGFAANATIYYNVANSDISNVNNWGTNTDGSTGTGHPSNFTTSGDIFRVYNGTTNIVGATVAFASSSSSAPVTLVIGDGTTAAGLTVSATFTLTVGNSVVGTSGALTVATGSTLTVSGTLAANAGDGAGSVQINGTLVCSSGGTVTGLTATMCTVNGLYQHNTAGGTIPTVTWGTGSTCYVTSQAAANPGGMTQSFYNLTWDCQAQSGTIQWWNTSTTSMTINGTLWVKSTNNQQIRMTSVTNGSTYNFTINGSVVVGDTTPANINSTTTSLKAILSTNGSGSAFGTYNIIIKGNLATAAGGTFNLNGGGANSTSGAASTNTNITLSGNLSNVGTITGNNSTISASPFTGRSTYTFTFNKSGTQTYSNTGTIFSATSTSVNFTVNSGSTLDVGTSVIPNGIGFTLNSGATLQTANTGGIANNASFGSTSVPSLSTGANYSFNGSSAQVTGALMPATINGLTVNNTAGVTLSQATTVSSAISLTAGAFNLNSLSFTLGNSATITRLGGTISAAPTFGTSVNVTYGQNASAIITGVELPTSTSVLNNLNVTSTNGVTLNAAATVNGTLTLGGNLTIGNNNLTLNNANPVAGTPSTSKHIVTNGTGVVTTTTAFSTSYTFPVGYDGSNYNPVAITPNNETPSVLVKSISPTLSATVSTKAMWTIGGLTSSSTTLAFPWNSSTDISGTFQAGMILYSYNGSAWSSISGSSTGGASPSYTTTLTGVTISNTSTFGVGPNATPTVSLTSATGTDAQTTNTASAITTITYSWGGAATGASVTWTGTSGSSTPPTGITVNTSSSVSISGTASVAGSYGYTVTTVGGSPAATATGTLTITATPAVTISAISSVGNANVFNGTTSVSLTNFSIAVANASSSVTGLSLPITAGGGLVAGDLTNYKLYYTTNSSFTSPTLLSTATSGLATSPIVFPSFSQAIGSGSTGYFWVTVDFSASATSTHTISAASISGSNLTFGNTVTNSGSVAAGGTLTLVYPTYYNVLNSDISNLNNWGTNPDGSGTHPSSFTVANVTYNLYNGSANTVGTSIAFSGLGTTFTIGDGTNAAGLSIAASKVLTIGTLASYNVATNTILTVAANATLTISGTLTNYGAITDNTAVANFVVNGTYEVGGNPTAIANAAVPVAATWSTGSTLLVSGVTANLPPNLSPTPLPFYNVTWNSANQNTALAFSWAGKTLAGSFTVNNSNNQPVRFYGISGTTTTTISGSLTISGANAQVSVSGSSGTGVANVYIGGDFNLSAGTFYFNTGGSSQTTPTTLFITGNLNVTGGTITAGTTGLGLVNTITFQGSTIHTYTNSATAGAFTNVNVTVPSGETLNIGANTIATPYKFNLNAGATLQTTSGTGINGNLPTTSTITLDPAANYVFSGSSAQTTGALLTNAANLTINNSAGVTLSGATTVSGTLILTSGALANSTVLTLGNGATISRSGGTIASTPNFGTTVNVIYTQNASAITTGLEIPSTATVLNNLTINSSNGVVLGSNASVNGTLALTSGQLSLGSNNLALSSAHAVSGTLGVANHILTNGSGYVTSTSTFSSPYTFPVGYSTGSYNPVTITPTAETPTVKVAAISPALTNSLKAMWTIGGVTSTSSVIAFTWISGTDNVGLSQKAGMVYSYSGSSWGTALDNSSTSGSNPNYTTTLNNTSITSPSIFTVGPPSAATLALSSAVGTDGQTANTTTSITDITYDFSGSASTASVSWTGTASSTTVPTGLSVSVDLVNNVVTISGKATVAGNYGYTVTTDGTPAASKSGIITVAATASVSLVGFSPVAVGNIFPGSTNNALTNFYITPSGSAVTLTSLSVPITATVGATELTNFKLYYTSSSTFSTANLLATVSSALSTSPIVFSSFTQTVANGSKGYFWITTDVSNTSAVLGHTITANAITSGALAYVLNENTTGTVAAGGVQTITNPIYFNVANSDVSNVNNWGDNPDGTGMHPANFTGSNATYNLKNGIGNYVGTSTTFSGSGTILTIGDSTNNAAVTISGTSTLTIGTGTASTGSLIISPKGTLTIASTASCTVAAGGSINISNATATLNVYGYFKNSGTVTATNNTVTGVLNVTGAGSTYEHNINGGTIPFATWGTGSTLLLNAISTTSPTFSGSTFYNVTWNCPSQSVPAGPIFGNTTINGNLTISSTGSNVLRFLGMAAAASNTISIGGNFSISGNSQVYTNGSTNKGYAIYNLGGNFSMTSGSSFYLNKGAGASSCVINLLGGSFNNAGTITTNTPATDSNAIVFKGSGVQTFTNSGTFATTLANTVISVNSGANVSITSATTIPALSIASGATVANSANLNVLYGFTNNGTVSGAGTIILSGTAAQTVSGNGIIGNFTLNNSNGATVTTGAGNSLGITGLLNLQNGTLTTNGNVTLKSISLANTGTLAAIDGVTNKGAISGNVTVERYIPKGFRGYRDMAPEVYGAGTINANWQEGATNVNSNPKPGYGIFITGSNTADATNAGKLDANGFDYAAIAGLNTQDYTYDPLYTNPIPIYGHFKALTNTTSTNLNPFTGYRLLIRGDRSANLYTSPVTNTQSGLAMFNATTLRATGQLVTGDVTYRTLANGGVTNTVTGGDNTVGLNTTVGGFSLVANPYVCPVQWSSVYSTSGGAATSNINGSYWYLDPTYGATGRYLAYNALTGTATIPSATTYDTVGGGNKTYGTTTVLGNIQAGQAVFVQTIGSNPQVLFKENAKVASTTKTSVFGAAQLSKIYVSLLKQTTGATTYDMVDGAAVAFRSDFGNKAYGPQDAIKFSSTTDNLAISDKGKNLSIDGRLPATASDAIALKISNPTATAYRLSIDASAYANNGFEPLLYDAFKNTTKALGTGTSTVDFTVDTAKAASFSNRFTILFAPSALPVNSIVANASLSNKTATITWNTVGEKNVASYEVEKSTDAKSFTAIGQVTAKNTATASYTSTDNSVTTTTYYRIKAISSAGSISYSNVAKVTYDLRLTTYALYPNPLTGKTLNVSLDNVVAGKYTVSIYNALGQRVITQTISHTGGSATHAISINSALAAGVYNVSISEANSKQVVHQSSLIVEN